MREKIAGIYAIVNTVNCRRYVGSTSDMHVRRIAHFSELRRRVHINKHLQRSWNRHGSEAFIFVMVERCEVAELHLREQHHLDECQPNVFNHGPIAAHPMRGTKWTDEERLRRKPTHEWRAKMSALRLGKPIGPRSEAFKAEMSARLTGRKLSADHRRNIGIGVTGTKKPASFVASLVARNKGNKFALGLKRSRESVEAGAAARRGRKHSEEHKAALRAAWVRRKARMIA